jgi:Xaa-Pro aminopeptidase
MYNEFTQNPVHELKNILEELGVSGEQVAVEVDFVPYAALDQLYQLMPQTHFVPAHDFFARQRMLKTQGELDILRRVNKVAEQAHYYAASKAHAGMTELRYAQDLSAYLFDNGVESINKLVVGAGERSEHPNANPTSRLLQTGELVRADIFAKIQGYLSDVARTAVVGSPTADQKAKWEIVYEARNLILEKICPGAQTREIYAAFCRHFEKDGLIPTNFVGHGLGITLHEDPYISRYHEQELQPGMVLAIEPMFFSNGEGYQLEEIVVVTETGAELITDYSNPKDLIIIEP